MINKIIISLKIIKNTVNEKYLKSYAQHQLQTIWTRNNNIVHVLLISIISPIKSSRKTILSAKVFGQ